MKDDVYEMEELVLFLWGQYLILPKAFILLITTQHKQVYFCYFPCFVTSFRTVCSRFATLGVFIGPYCPDFTKSVGPFSLNSTPCFTKTHHLQIKERRFMLSSSWRTIKLKQISSVVHGQVAPTTTVGLRAIKLWRRWRAFRSHSRTYRSNGDKWDVTALVKQGYNLSKSNIICDPLWHPLSLSLSPSFFFSWHLNTVIVPESSPFKWI